MKKFILIFFGLILFFSFMSCQKPKSEYRAIPIERILERLNENYNFINSFKAEGSIDVNLNGNKNSSDIELSVKKSDSLYISLFGPFGIELGYALATKSKLIFVNNFSNKVVEASTSKENIKKMLKIDFEFNNLIDLLFGSLEIPKVYEDDLNYTVDEEFYILNFKRKDLIYQYFIDIRFLAIAKAIMYRNDNQKVMEINFSKFLEKDGGILPQLIQFENYETKEKIKIEYSTVTVNPQNLIFDLQIPEDAEKIVW